MKVTAPVPVPPDVVSVPAVPFGVVLDTHRSSLTQNVTALSEGIHS